MTVSELAAIAGISAGRMREVVRIGVQEGKYQCVGQGVRRDACGRIQRPQVYRVVKAKKK